MIKKNSKIIVFNGERVYVASVISILICQTQTKATFIVIAARISLAETKRNFRVTIMNS